VCLGNICRSPTAEGVMAKLVHEAGLEHEIHLDSAGTGGWHVGGRPDQRATAAAKARGISLEGKARMVRPEDFENFDLVLAMDAANLRELRQLAPGEAERAKVRLLREFDPGAHDPDDRVKGAGDLDVPDPYYGASAGFEEVLDLVQAACEGLLAQIRAGTLA
jgi:low molecular weight protein-tyrosine phosphatase